MNLEIKSWPRESHGLFDYDNKYVDEQILRITNTCFVCNDDNILDGVAPETALQDTNLNKLFTCVFKNGKYWIYHSRDFDEDDMIKNPVDQTWISLREVSPTLFKKQYSKRLGYKLKEGDIIKFGRVRFQVRSLGSYKRKTKANRLDPYDVTKEVSMTERLIRRYSKKPKGPRDTQNSFDSSIFQNHEDRSGGEHSSVLDRLTKLSRKAEAKDIMTKRKDAQCRICLGGEEDEDICENPLISPCKCNGTMQYIHLECLRQWLESKIHTKSTEFTYSYNWKNLVCELCGERLKDNYFINGKITYVLNYLRPDNGNYLILESYTNTPHKTIHVLVSDKNNNPENAEVEY